MHVISVNNVREALPKAVEYLFVNGKTEQTRNGLAIVAPGPVTIHYKFPKQHVLLNPIRDANPFFHLMEAMWMLVGRDDGQFLDHYIKGFSKMYGNTDGRIMDAYGYRWRYGLYRDQLHEIARQLKENPATRQCVLQMWGAGRQDLFEAEAKPCNLNAVFRVHDDKLNMMVQNRSNDLIWGACGANTVHFSILLEYIAALSGLQMGEYWQVSNNLHMYQDHVQMLFERIGFAVATNPMIYNHLTSPPGYEDTMPLVANPITFNVELNYVMQCIDMLYDVGYAEINGTIIKNPFLNVVWGMALGHYLHRKQMSEGIETINKVEAEDWRKAGLEWMERRRG